MNCSTATMTDDIDVDEAVNKVMDEMFPDLIKSNPTIYRQIRQDFLAAMEKYM